MRQFIFPLPFPFSSHFDFHGRVPGKASKQASKQAGGGQREREVPLLLACLRLPGAGARARRGVSPFLFPGKNGEQKIALKEAAASAASMRSLAN